MATHIFAIFSAGASLIPSPVTATILLCLLSKETILSLSSGEVLQNITHLFSKSFNNWISLCCLILSHVTINGSS